MLVHWVWLAHRPGLSDWVRWQILQQYGDPEAVYFAKDYRDVEDLSPEGLKSLRDKDLSSSEKILEACVNERIGILTIQDALYCTRLRNIPDPPILLYYKGQVPDLDSTAVIGVVGTRKASLYGLSVARSMGSQLGKAGGIVVSGLAKGIDAQAMGGAMEGGGRAVGVLGCGVDQIYPSCNRKLFEDTERFGCIFSEFPPGTPPLSGNFPKRNRIISGLSCGVLVVEAPVRSGALITARQAADQGRDVFVVPGNIGVPVCQGSNSLLRDGAIAVSCGWDILSEYEYRYAGKLRGSTASIRLEEGTVEDRPVEISPEQEPPVKQEIPEDGTSDSGQETDAGPEKSGKAPKKAIDNQAAEPYIDINDILSKCSPSQKAIVLVLQEGQCLVDHLIEQTGLCTNEVLSALTMLEIRGVIKRLPGRQISLRQ